MRYRRNTQTSDFSSHNRESNAMPTDYEFTTNWFKRGKRDRWRAYFAKLPEASPVRMLEIGSYEGRSAVFFAETLGERLRLDTVDPLGSPEVRDRFMTNTRHWRAAGVITHYSVHSTRGLADLLVAGAQYDAINVDGSHEALNVLYDGVMSLRLVKVGGVVCFDDYRWNSADTIEPPKNAIDLLCRAHAPFVTVLHKADQVWLRKTADFNSLERMSKIWEVVYGAYSG